MLHLLCSAYNLVIGNSIELVAVVKCFKQLGTFFFQAKVDRYGDNTDYQCSS
jgi:hypothetical protein